MFILVSICIWRARAQVVAWAYVAAASGIIASEIAATVYEKGMNCLPRLPFRYLRLRDRRSNPNDYALQPAGRSIQEVQMTVRTAST